MMQQYASTLSDNAGFKEYSLICTFEEDGQQAVDITSLQSHSAVDDSHKNNMEAKDNQEEAIAIRIVFNP